MTRRPVSALDAALALFALGVVALGGALSYLAGWALSRALDTARALAVPLVACATHKRHGLLSRPEAGRTAMPTPRPGVQNWTPTPGLERTLPASATPPPPATQGAALAACPYPACTFRVIADSAIAADLTCARHIVTDHPWPVL